MKKLLMLALSVAAVIELMMGGAEGLQYAIDPVTGAIVGGTVLNLLGGAGGGKQKSQQTTDTTTTSTSGFNIESLPPELQEMLGRRLGQGDILSSLLFGETANLPPGLSLGGLESSMGRLGGIEGLLRGFGDLRGIERAADELVGGSLANVRGQLTGELGILEDEARRLSEGAINQIQGSLGARGLLGSTPGAAQIGRAVGGIQSDLQRTLQAGQNQLGNLGVAGLGQTVGALLTGRGQGIGALQGAGSLGLGRTGQLLALRGARDRNLAQLVANPQIANLLGIAGTTSTSRTQGTTTGQTTGGGGFGQAAGGLGSSFLEAGLKAKFG